MNIEEVGSNPSIDASPVAPQARIPLGMLIGDLANEMDKTKKTIDHHKQVTNLQLLKDTKDDVKLFTEERLEDLKQIAEAKENQNLWSFGHLISSVSYASVSIVFG